LGRLVNVEWRNPLDLRLRQIVSAQSQQYIGAIQRGSQKTG
jgi:hypothetical protein